MILKIIHLFINVKSAPKGSRAGLHLKQFATAQPDKIPLWSVKPDNIHQTALCSSPFCRRVSREQERFTKMNAKTVKES